MLVTVHIILFWHLLEDCIHVIDIRSNLSRSSHYTGAVNTPSRTVYIIMFCDSIILQIPNVDKGISHQEVTISSSSSSNVSDTSGRVTILLYFIVGRC